MSTYAVRWIVTGALLGALTVVLGAYGAHGLEARLVESGFGTDLPRRMAHFETAVRYQMYGAVALVLLGILLDRRNSRVWKLSAAAILLGILAFSGPLYLLAMSGPEWKWLGAIAPFGGVATILGWLGIAIGAMMATRKPE